MSGPPTSTPACHNGPTRHRDHHHPARSSRRQVRRRLHTLLTASSRGDRYLNGSEKASCSRLGPQPIEGRLATCSRPVASCAETSMPKPCGPFWRPNSGASVIRPGLIGPGSEILGFDTERSSDHHWGPRVQLFVERHDPTIADVLARRLPHHFQGWSTSFANPDPDDNGVRLLEERTKGP